MKNLYLLLFSFVTFFSFADAEDMVLVKDGNVFLADQGFVKKDLLIDEGKIILIEDQIGDVGAGNIIYAQDKYITPGLVVFSSLGLLEIGALSETNDNSSNIYNAGFDPSKAYNPFSQAVRLNRSKGVTSTVHIPGASGYFSGLLSHTKINNGWKQKKQGPLAVLTSYGQSRGIPELLNFNSCLTFSTLYEVDLKIKLTMKLTTFSFSLAHKTIINSQTEIYWP